MGGSRGGSVSHSLILSLSLQSQWKAGKRKAEKDEMIAGMFFSTIEHPEVHMERETAYVITDRSHAHHMIVTCLSHAYQMTIT